MAAAPTKGGGGLTAAAPLCRFLFWWFSLRQGLFLSKLIRLLLKSHIFPFNPFWLAGAKHKITFWGPKVLANKSIFIFAFLNLTFIYHLVLGSDLFDFDKLFDVDKLRIQGRMNNFRIRLRFDSKFRIYATNR